MLRSISYLEKNVVFAFLLFAAIGIEFPHHLLWANHLLQPLLTIIAFCVGLTLKPAQFSDAWKNKKFILPILAFKYTFTPFITYIVCILLNIPSAYIVGLVTLTCCPAANTGNIMCYLSKGNTAMIVITTITGALIAPVITPTIIYLLLHKVVEVHFFDTLRIIFTGVTAPMLMGIIINRQFPKLITPLTPIIPSIGIISVSLIIAAVLAKNINEIMYIEIYLPILCTLLISLFLVSGFLFSKFIKCSIENSIALSFEIGTFDGVLGILLAQQLGSNSAVLPVILFAVLNLIIGSIASKIYTSNYILRLAK